MTKIIFAKNVDSNEPVGVEEEDLIEHRAQILANSGGGKSHICRSLAENAYGRFQQIIISPKAEYVTLREKFDYLHVGKSSDISKPDIELNTRYASQLAIKLLESQANCIIEFSQAPLERVKYVRQFLEGIMSAPMSLAHPCMILIDEIDIWAPEKGHGEAESLQAVIDLAARGRDRGYFLVAATQNLSKFNKDVASELDIKMVGKVSLDIHQSRAAQELGISLKEKGKLRFLGKPYYHFYAFGPGLSDDIIKIQSLPVQTTHESSYKRNKNLKQIPTPAKIKSIVSQFSDLPQEAEREIKTKDDMMRKIREQEGTIKVLQRQQPKIDPEYVKKVEQSSYAKGFNDGVRETQKQYVEKIKGLEILYNRLKPKFTKIQQLSEQISRESIITDAIDTKITIEMKQVPQQVPPLVPSTTTIQIPDTQSIQQLANLERKILTAICQRGSDGGTRSIIAAMVEYHPKSKSFTNAISHLKSMGYIDYSGQNLTATELGAKEITFVEPFPHYMEERIEWWSGRLQKLEAGILRLVCSMPNLTRDEIAEKVSYHPKSKSFTNALSHIRSIGLVDYEGNKVIPTKEMNP